MCEYVIYIRTGHEIWNGERGVHGFTHLFVLVTCNSQETIAGDQTQDFAKIRRLLVCFYEYSSAIERPQTNSREGSPANHRQRSGIVPLAS